jgi:hypothetical protein
MTEIAKTQKDLAVIEQCQKDIKHFELEILEILKKPKLKTSDRIIIGEKQTLIWVTKMKLQEYEIND